MKRSDISDEHVLDLARRWQQGKGPGVVHALVDEGIPIKLARAKVYHMNDRGLLDYGVSVDYSWPSWDNATDEELEAAGEGAHERLMGALGVLRKQMGL